MSRSDLSQELRQELEDAFSLFDRENKGMIDGKDLKGAMRALGFEPRMEEIKKLMTDIAVQSPNDTGGKISLDQFTKLMTPKLADKDSKAEIMKAFRLFDDDETGRISFSNLKRVAKELGENITDDELNVTVKITI